MRYVCVRRIIKRPIRQNFFTRKHFMAFLLFFSYRILDVLYAVVVRSLSPLENSSDSPTHTHIYIYTSLFYYTLVAM
jgi:hypothetical protein